MSSFNDHLDEQIERDFTKHGWRRVSEGQTAFYEAPYPGEPMNSWYIPGK